MTKWTNDSEDRFLREYIYERGHLSNWYVVRLNKDLSGIITHAWLDENVGAREESWEHVTRKNYIFRNPRHALMFLIIMNEFPG